VSESPPVATADTDPAPQPSAPRRQAASETPVRSPVADDGDDRGEHSHDNGRRGRADDGDRRQWRPVSRGRGRSEAPAPAPTPAPVEDDQQGWDRHDDGDDDHDHDRGRGRGR
jgi:hypothetical protein